MACLHIPYVSQYLVIPISSVHLVPMDSGWGQPVSSMLFHICLCGFQLDMAPFLPLPEPIQNQSFVACEAEATPPEPCPWRQEDVFLYH
jgi:hypothetical protein